ncbi:hypothetical protein [Reticulibacter mediterranei]|uniref:hypothetical protein n=1 Tax=Reticulibacter mediterranei TaxID=2778369 RepID=UPI001C692B6A|nr:hypothetical protein [Reticulibacter mediterranei]
MHALDDMARPLSFHIWAKQREQEDACPIDAPKAFDMAGHHVGFEHPGGQEQSGHGRPGSSLRPARGKS